jgi:hypothetical protein
MNPTISEARSYLRSGHLDCRGNNSKQAESLPVRRESSGRAIIIKTKDKVKSFTVETNAAANSRSKGGSRITPGSPNNQIRGSGNSSENPYYPYTGV